MITFGQMLADLGVALQMKPHEIVEFTPRQARLYWHTSQARDAERLRSLCRVILAGCAPTAGKAGVEIYDAVRDDLEAAAFHARRMI